jgi:hypothetical protein
VLQILDASDVNEVVSKRLFFRHSISLLVVRKKKQPTAV